jgi:imidazolonepropionase-like amidohydrolase
MARGLELLVAFTLVVLAVSSNGAQDQRSRMVAFTHVAVIDTEHAQTRDDQTVLVAGGRISDVGPSKRISVRGSAQVIDASGKFLIPGLWDMHVHTFTHNPRLTNVWFFPLLIANGVTGVRDMWTTSEDLPQVLEWRKGMADGSFLGPRYGAVGWLVDGPEPMWPGSDVVKTPQEARDFVRRAKAAGVDFVKVYSKLLPDEFLAIADEAKQVGILFAGHVPDAVRAATASDAGQRSMEHLRNIMLGCSTKEDELIQVKTWGPQQVKEARDTFDQNKCEQLMRQLAGNQSWQVPTLVVHDTSINELRTRYVPLSLRARPATPQAEGRANAQSPGQLERLRIVALMNQAAVPLLAGTDVAQKRLYPGFSLHDELALFVKAGLTPGEALKAATYSPAKFLGMLDRLGTVDKGKLGDLVLLDANPLDDIHNTQKIRAVVLNGRYLDRAALDKLLTNAATAAATR